jgi:hypothetical protein
MKKLSEADIIRMMREEWDAKVAELSETVDVLFKTKVDGEEKSVIGPGLKLRNKVGKGDSKKKPRGYLYTVVAVGPRDTVLQTPEGKQFTVDNETLEAEYELD